MNESNTDPRRCIKFNMGHRMEIYIHPDYASDIIEISKSVGIDAKIIEVLKSQKKKLSIQSELGNFEY